MKARICHGYIAWVVIVVAIMGLALSAGGAEPAMDTIRVFRTEPACFEYLFTGMVSETDGRPLLAFNHRNGRTSFVRPGETLGRFQVMAFEPKTNHIYNSSLHAYLDESSGTVTLAGPGDAVIILEQGRPLPWPGHVAWLVCLDRGFWWNVQEQDIFLMGDQPVFVEEIDEDGIMVSAGQNPQFIRRISFEEKNGLQRLWAEQKRREQQAQALALQRRQEAAKLKVTAAADSGASYFTYERGTRVEIRGPTRFFYGCEYRFPTAFKAYPTAQYSNGRLVPSYIVLPTRFETRRSGISLIGP